MEKEIVATIYENADYSFTIVDGNRSNYLPDGIQAFVLVKTTRHNLLNLMSYSYTIQQRELKKTFENKIKNQMILQALLEKGRLLKPEEKEEINKKADLLLNGNMHDR